MTDSTDLEMMRAAVKATMAVALGHSGSDSMNVEWRDGGSPTSRQSGMGHGRSSVTRPF